MTNSKKMTAETTNSTPGTGDDLHPAAASHCYIIHQQDREPDEDEDIDDEQIFDGIYFCTASSKEEALKHQVQRLMGEGFWALGKNSARSNEVAEWTDGWTDSTIAVYAIGENGFWECLSWDKEIWGEELVVWAGSNKAIALQLLTSAKGGHEPGHQAVAKHLGLLSVVEQAELQLEVPAEKATQKSRKSSSL